MDKNRTTQQQRNELRSIVRQAVNVSSEDLAKELGLKQVDRFEPVLLPLPEGDRWLVWDNETMCWIDGTPEFKRRILCKIYCNFLNAKLKTNL